MLIARPSMTRSELIWGALAIMPPANTGYNPSLTIVGHKLRACSLCYDSAVQLAFDRADELGVPEWRKQEIIRAFRKVFYTESGYKNRQTGGHLEGSHLRGEFPDVKPDLDAIAKVCQTGITCDQLRNASPLDPVKYNTWQILKMLYPDRNTLLCMGKAAYDFLTVKRDEELKPQGYQFIVPNAMIKYIGYTQEGTLSTHCLEATGPRIYLAQEWDFTYYDPSGKNHTIWYDLLDVMSTIGRTRLDMCASLIAELDSYTDPSMKLAMVVYSGGKSLQGWWSCKHTDPELVKDFFRQALILGACRSTWTRSQFVRMPGGTRIRRDDDNDRDILVPQPVYYLNL